MGGSGETTKVVEQPSPVGTILDKSPAFSVRSSQKIPEPLLPDNQLGMEETPRHLASPAGVPTTPLLNPLATPVHSPCRNTRNSPVPSLADASQPRPVPGTLHLTEAAIEQRLRRLMTPKASGEYKVSKDIVRMFKAGGKSKIDVFHMFQSVGFDPDRLHALLLGATNIFRIICSQHTFRKTKMWSFPKKEVSIST